MDCRERSYKKPWTEVSSGIVTCASILISSIVVDPGTEVDDEAAKEYNGFYDLWDDLWDEHDDQP